MKLSAIVVTYYPEMEVTVGNILSYIDQVDQLIIWENTPGQDAARYHVRVPGYEHKIIYRGTGKNEFIAYPLNRAVEWSLANGYTHMLSMDQDSIFEAGHFGQYLERIEQTEQRDRIAIFGVNPNNYYKVQPALLKSKWLITSGSVYVLEYMNKIGAFREDYQIDAVDNEICYKATLNGFDCVIDTHCLLHQEFGHKKKYLGFIYSVGYSPFRIYSITCNHILLWKEYSQQIGINLKWKIVRSLLVFCVMKIILLENEKRRKLRALFLGLKDGLNNSRKERIL